MNPLFQIDVRLLDGSCLDWEAYENQWILIVNVASQCGFTPQYAELQTLYEQYRQQHLVVLGCPCDQFSHQEPGDAQEIRQFCDSRYQIRFPLTEKIKVNGPDAHALFRWLKSQKRGFWGQKRITWNFTKFLVNPSGQVVKRFSPMTPVMAVERYLLRCSN